MSIRTAIIGVTAVLALSPLLGGCEYMPREKPPTSGEIGNSVGKMYIQAGVAAEIGKREILGKHYQPGSDSWKVVACTGFTLPDGGSGRDCNDSFELYKLDSGKWMVSGTVNGGYMWLEMP